MILIDTLRMQPKIDVRLHLLLRFAFSLSLSLWFSRSVSICFFKLIWSTEIAFVFIHPFVDCLSDWFSGNFLLFGHWDRSETHPAYLPTFSVKFFIDAYLFFSSFLFSHLLFTYTYILFFSFSIFTYTYSYAYTFIFFLFICNDWHLLRRFVCVCVLWIDIVLFKMREIYEEENEKKFKWWKDVWSSGALG